MGTRSFAAAALLAGLLSSAPAGALTINLNDIGGVANTPAELGFRAAARYWESVFTNPATINIDVGYSSLGAGILGGTSPTLYQIPVAVYAAQLDSIKTSSIDIKAVGSLQAQLDVNGALKVITPGYVDEVNKLGIDNAKRVFDTDGSYNNRVIVASGANLRAMGFAPQLPNDPDAVIQFSSDFGFDFNPANGITPGSYDFVGVAIHEIGHALGFLSGADDYDFLGGPNGPGAGFFDDYPVNDDWWGYSMDLWRYSDNPDGFGGGGAKLDWAPGSAAFFSLDGGASDFFGGKFSTGVYHGDGNQASHWKANGTCQGFLGIMNPYICDGENDSVSALDLALFDAIGWDLNIDVEASPGYLYSTANIVVPTPPTWSLVLALLGGVGVVTRRRAA